MPRIECPEYIIMAIRIIEDAMKAKFNGHGEQMWQNPFTNSGGEYKSKVFTVSATTWDWSKDGQPNFKFEDVEVSWVNHLGSCTTINRRISHEEAVNMALKCIKSLKTAGKGNHGKR